MESSSLMFEDLELFDGDVDATLAATLAYVDAFPSLTSSDAVLYSPLASADDAKTASSTVQSDSDEKTHSSRGSATSSGSPEASNTRQCARKRPKRLELGQLRETVRELESELRSLAGKPQTRKHLCLKDASPLERMWQGIAQTQMDQRQRSEAENAKLRVMLDEQIRLMKSLERQVVKNRSTVELLSWKLPTGPKRGLRVCGKPGPLDTASIELDMQKTVLEMLGQVDRVVMDARFQDVVAGEVLQKTECHTDKRDGIVVEAMEARMLPADCQASAKALWNLLTRHTAPHKTMVHEVSSGSLLCVHEDIQTGDKTVRRVFEALLDFPKVTGHFRAKLIHQFFYARDRVVILTHALMDPMQINDKPIDGLFTRTRQWHVLESANILDDQPATLLRMYYVSTPHIFDQKMPTSARRQGLGILSNFLMQSAPVYSSIHRQMLENRLMEDLLGMNMCL